MRVYHVYQISINLNYPPLDKEGKRITVMEWWFYDQLVEDIANSSLMSFRRNKVVFIWLVCFIVLFRKWRLPWHAWFWCCLLWYPSRLRPWKMKWPMDQMVFNIYQVSLFVSMVDKNLRGHTPHNCVVGGVDRPGGPQDPWHQDLRAQKMCQ